MKCGRQLPSNGLRSSTAGAAGAAASVTAFFALAILLLPSLDSRLHKTTVVQSNDDSLSTQNNHITETKTSRKQHTINMQNMSNSIRKLQPFTTANRTRRHSFSVRHHSICILVEASDAAIRSRSKFGNFAHEMHANFRNNLHLSLRRHYIKWSMHSPIKNLFDFTSKFDRNQNEIRSNWNLPPLAIALSDEWRAGSAKQRFARPFSRPPV